MLDTNIISYVLKRPHSPIAERYRRTPAADLAISVIVESELRYGVARLPKEAGLPILVEEALRTLSILPWDSACARQCAFLRTRLGETGLPLSYADAMIAAHALALNLTLITNDHAFERVPGLRLENWATNPADPIK
jgi:tRNA(fMet)-specific endonuclease VapC